MPCWIECDAAMLRCCDAIAAAPPMPLYCASCHHADDRPRCSCTMLKLPTVTTFIAVLVVQLSGVTPVAAVSAGPVSYWRCEGRSSPGADSVATGGVPVKPTNERTYSPKHSMTAGLLADMWKSSTRHWLPRVGPSAINNSKRDHCRVPSDRAALSANGNTTLFAVTPSAPGPTGGWIEAGGRRHGLAWRADASLARTTANASPSKSVYCQEQFHAHD